MKTDCHPILFNGDPHIFFRDPVTNRFQPEGGRFSSKNIRGYVKLLSESGVNALLICANTQVAWHPSRVWPTILDEYSRGNHDFFSVDGIAEWLSEQERAVACAGMVQLLDRYLDLKEDGVDWLAEACSACRQFGVAPWVSVRMNDLHGHPYPDTDWRMRNSQFANPRMRLSGRCLYPKDGSYFRWSGLNYALSEVRDHMFALIREMVQDYDIDGVELDWWRDPRCCEYPASEADIEQVTEWLGTVRQLTLRRGKGSGVPCQLGIRGPQNLGLLRSIGLDLAAMATQGSIDFFTPSNHWQTSWETDYDSLRRQLGDGISLYGCIEDAPNWIKGSPSSGHGESIRFLSASPELLRGNAANKWAAGVDGIEFFNFYCSDPGENSFSANWVPQVAPQYQSISSLAVRSELRGQSKHYALATLVGAYQPFDEVSPLPRILPPQGKAEVRLTMCAEPADAGLDFVIQVVVKKTERIPELGVGFNGAWPSFECTGTQNLLFPIADMTLHTSDHVAFNFCFPVRCIVEGWNTITVWNSGHGPNEPRDPSDLSVTVVSVECGIFCPAQK